MTPTDTDRKAAKAWVNAQSCNKAAPNRIDAFMAGITYGQTMEREQAAQIAQQFGFNDLATAIRHPARDPIPTPEGG